MEASEQELWGEGSAAEAAAAAPCPRSYPTDLEELRNSIRTQRFIPSDLSDQFLQYFLDAKGQDVAKATKMVRKYFYLRQEPGPVFRDRNPLSATNQKLFEPLYAVPLRNLFNDGEVFLLTGLLHPIVKYSALAHFKLIALTIDFLLWDKTNKVASLKILMDGKNFQCPGLLENPFRHLKSFIRDFQRSTPINLEGLYLLRPPEHAQEIARIHDGLWINTLETPEEVAAKFPAAILPFEHGGSLGSLEEVLEAWNLQVKERSRFFVQFERKMICDYTRRMYHEREVREGGRHWVPRMKLAGDSEYKRRYYERMANLKPTTHPAFGKQRLFNRPRARLPEDPLKRLRDLIRREEQEEEMLWTAVADVSRSECRPPPEPVEIFLCILPGR